MEVLVLLAACFVFLPLPLCIYLLVQRRRLAERLDSVEAQLRRNQQFPTDQEQPASRASFSPPPPESAPKATPQPEPTEPEPPSRGLAEPTPAPRPRPSSSEAPPSRPEPTPAPQPVGLPVFLRSIGLLPPSDLERSEAGLIQWWALRLGGLLAVLAAIFFSVYISQNTTPLVRFLELLAADAAVIALGAYFYKRRPRFGATLLTIGLSMLYVSMVAGYAAAPVRVFTNPLVGISAQLLVIAVIYATSIRLGERSMTLLATAFGYASSIFSAYLGLNEGALLTALALQLTGVAFAARWQHAPLLSLATLGAYLPLLAFSVLALLQSQTVTAPYPLSIVAFLAVAVSALPAVAWRTRLAQGLSLFHWRSLALANTSLCGALGYAYFKLTDGELTLLYGPLALVFLAWASLFARRGLNTLLFQLFFLKGCGLAALWLANTLAGELRWLALAVECLLIAWSTRHSLSKWSEAATFLLWLAALWLAIDELPRQSALAFASAPWFFYALLPLIGALALSLQKQALPSDRARGALYFVAGLVSGALAAAVVSRSDFSDAHNPIALACFAAAFAALALLPKLSRLPLAAAASPPLLLTHVAFWLTPSSTLACLVALALTAAFAYAAASAYEARRPSLNLPELALVLLATTTLYAYLFSGYSAQAWFPLLAPALAIALKTVRVPPLKASADAFLLPLLLDLAFHVPQAQDPTARILSLLLYGLLLASPRLLPQRERCLRFLGRYGLGRNLAHLLVAAIALASAPRLEGWLATQLALLGSASAFFYLWRLHRHRIALMASLVLFAVPLFSLAAQALSQRPDAPWSWQVLLVGLVLAALTLLCGSFLARRPARRLNRQARQLLAGLAALASYLAIVSALAFPPLSLDSYYTPVIALYCLLLISLGIALKVKPFRIVALLGFLLPLGRLFLVDMQQTLHRIVAFAVLAVLLTTIGYLYTRFASRIK